MSFKQKTLIAAHRGVSHLYPENTLISFKKALELNVDMIELDIHMTKDKQIVVIHDNTLDRTTDGNGKVKEMTLKEIKQYSAGRWLSEQFKNEKVPTLKEVFTLVKKKTILRIELKQTGLEKQLLSLIKKYNMTDNVICGSFYLESISKIRKMNPYLPVTFITEHLKVDKLKTLLSKNINMVDVHLKNIDTGLVKTCHSYGFVIAGWTPYTKKELKQTLKSGVDVITTNCPHILKDLLK